MALSAFKFPSPGRVYIPKPHRYGYNIRAKFKVRFHNRGHRVGHFLRDKWAKSFLYRAGGAIRTYAITSMKRSRAKRINPKTGKKDFKPSPAGRPPFAHVTKRAFLKKVLQFVVDLPAQYVLIGTDYSVAKVWGRRHEHGGRHRIAKDGPPEEQFGYFPQRAFMVPAFRRWNLYGRDKLMRQVSDQVTRTFSAPSP